MRIIVTGGTGLIGTQLCKSLAADGHEVIVLTRNPDKHRTTTAGIRMQQWDGKSTAGWGELVDGAGAVINLAGEGIADARWSYERKQRIHDSRTNAGTAILEAINAAKQKPEVLIQASAVGYYGVHSNEVLDESAPVGNDFLAKICFDWEASTAPVVQMGVRRAVIRTGVVLSNEGGAFPKQALPYKLFAGGHIGSGQQWYPWIHIDDEVAAIKFLLENKKAEGIYNLSAPNPLTNKEFSQKIGEVMGRPSILPVPAIALKILFGEMSTILLDGQRVIPKRLQEAGFQFKYPTAEAALKQLLK